MISHHLTTILAAFSILCLSPVCDAELTKNQLSKSLTFIKSTDSKKREAAYDAFRKLGDEEAESFEKVLKAAQKHHQKNLDRQLNSKSGNPYASFSPLATELKQLRADTMKLILTDYHKDASKIDKVMKAWKKVESLHKKAKRKTKSKVDSFEKKFSSTLAALSEIHRELQLLNGEPLEEDDEDELIVIKKDAITDLIDQSPQLQIFVAQRKTYRKFISELEMLAKVNADNKQMKWASSEQKEFARILNYSRSVMGLRPLTIEEKLSDASTGHSEDMQRINFFAHESPVPGKKTPADRAKKAQFSGRFRGENIAMGYNSPADNYRGWFYSDGHRFGLFAKGVEVLGVGISGQYWTMMTGVL